MADDDADAKLQDAQEDLGKKLRDITGSERYAITQIDTEKGTFAITVDPHVDDPAPLAHQLNSSLKLDSTFEAPDNSLEHRSFPSGFTAQPSMRDSRGNPKSFNSSNSDNTTDGSELTLVVTNDNIASVMAALKQHTDDIKAIISAAPPAVYQANTVVPISAAEALLPSAAPQAPDSPAPVPATAAPAPASSPPVAQAAPPTPAAPAPEPAPVPPAPAVTPPAAVASAPPAPTPAPHAAAAPASMPQAAATQASQAAAVTHPSHDFHSTLTIQAAMVRMGEDLGNTGVHSHLHAPAHKGVDGEWGPKTQEKFDKVCAEAGVDPKKLDFSTQHPTQEQQDAMNKFKDHVQQKINEHEHSGPAHGVQEHVIHSVGATSNHSDHPPSKEQQQQHGHPGEFGQFAPPPLPSRVGVQGAGPGR